ncbi:MAG: phosphoribosylamine--glycine ligase [Myxococcota bacterium]|nr:phosphoribosylamine--glycine ligase [Myxococcota bacterium]
MEKMNVLLVGAGGRESALAYKLLQSPVLKQLYVTEDHPGFAAANLVEDWENKHYDLVVVGPEKPLADGIADRFRERGVPVFGPSQSAALLEASKVFAKQFMQEQNIPTATYTVCHSKEEALSSLYAPCVVKADGLAGGKGVYVCQTKEEAERAVEEIFAGRFGSAGKRVVIEEFLEGPELSLIAVCNGSSAIPLLPCRDHKRRFENDKGPNTGGMGAICPPPDFDRKEIRGIMETVIDPVLQGMNDRGTPFIGALYAGLMLTQNGPKVLEFNVRFGDPECQPLMMMMKSDLLTLLYAAATGDMLPEPVWNEGASCCVVVCSKGYPFGPKKKALIQNLPENTKMLHVFLAGTEMKKEELWSKGGRVLAVCARSKDLESAREIVYKQLGQVMFEDMSFRNDIGVMK